MDLDAQVLSLLEGTHRGHYKTQAGLCRKLRGHTPRAVQGALLRLWCRGLARRRWDDIASPGKEQEPGVLNEWRVSDAEA